MDMALNYSSTRFANSLRYLTLAPSENRMPCSSDPELQRSMAPEVQAVARATEAWLQSSWHVQVPSAWLEACVAWLQEEAGEAARVPQQQINQQVLDQWLLTDLRDLDYPVLPEGLAQAQKTELSGTFCVQVDSLLDVSQPAYGQLQKWRGTDCSNDEVSAVTQTSQRPWEARATRMLLLQVTDGVQNLEAMEYQVIPALSTELRPGAKLQLQGKMVCRLGVLLLGPSNVKVLGGEVEDLVERNNKGRLLCRTLGLPEEQQREQEEEEAAPAPQQDSQEEDDMGLDDAELLAGLEAQEEVEMFLPRPTPDSGYGTLAVTSASSSRSSPSLRSFVSTISTRSETPTSSHRSGLTQSNAGGSVPRHRSEDQHHVSDMIYQETLDEHMADEDFPDEDFDDFPLDELDNVIVQEDAPPQAHSSHRNTPVTNSREPQHPSSTHSSSASEAAFSTSRNTSVKRDFHGCPKRASGHFASDISRPFIPPASPPEPEVVDITESECMDEDMDCFFVEAQDFGETTEAPCQPPSKDTEGFPSASNCGFSSKCSISVEAGHALQSSYGAPQRQIPPSHSTDRQLSKRDSQCDSTAPAVTLTSPPFTYLCVLEKLQPKPHTTEILVKAFIVTLLGKLSSSSGVWSISATISDGTGYLDVELSDAVLSNLLGFSVPEKVALRRDPARRAELEAGMRRCQEELVDMCCIMTIAVKPESRKAVVTKAEPVDEKVLHQLEQRVRGRKK